LKITPPLFSWQVGSFSILFSLPLCQSRFLLFFQFRAIEDRPLPFDADCGFLTSAEFFPLPLDFDVKDVLEAAEVCLVVLDAKFGSPLESNCLPQEIQAFDRPQPFSFYSQAQVRVPHFSLFCPVFPRARLACPYAFSLFYFPRY